MLGERGKCCGCSACANVCPKSAISMKADKEGFLRPVVDERKCIDCKLCEKSCIYYAGDIFKKVDIGKQEYFAFQNNSANDLYHSASGGAFTAISDTVLQNGGVVYGAVFDQNNMVVHARATTSEERNPMRKSKYVQSNMKDTFQQVQYDIKKGKTVLFTGTPCQCEGLLLYLGKHPDNLILGDFLCHGVPSPLIWSEYLKKREKESGYKISNIDFRNKEGGWRSYLTMNAGCREYKGDSRHDPYLIQFYQHFIVRPECHKCKFTNYVRISDFTIADFWGIEKMHIELDIESGVSLVLLNMEKSKKLIYSLKDKGILRRVKREDIFQPPLEYSFPAAKKREQYWEDFYIKGYGYVERKYTHLSLYSKFVKQAIVPLTKKIKVYGVIEKLYFRIKNKGARK